MHGLIGLKTWLAARSHHHIITAFISSEVKVIESLTLRVFEVTMSGEKDPVIPAPRSVPATKRCMPAVTVPLARKNIHNEPTNA
jgi:hypothetical protein